MICVPHQSSQTFLYTLHFLFLAASVMLRVGQIRTYTPYMTVYLVISMPKAPYIHRTYIDIWLWPTLNNATVELHLPIAFLIICGTARLIENWHLRKLSAPSLPAPQSPTSAHGSFVMSCNVGRYVGGKSVESVDVRVFLCVCLHVCCVCMRV